MDEKIMQTNDVSEIVRREFSKYVIDSSIRLGKAQMQVNEILDNEIFESLSKHDPSWHSSYEREAEKLDESRRALSSIQYQLFDLLATVCPEFDNE